jgi:uroporphyrinogen decarboxylase
MLRTDTMTSLERVFASLSFKQPDRVPIFLLFSFYGAKELEVSIEEYFQHPEWVLEAQKRFRKKFSNDCFNGFFYAPAEIEAWGGEVIFAEDGPPNSGEPFIRDIEQIKRLEVPAFEECQSLMKTLEAIELMKEEGKDEVPIIGVALSPFSVPVMQMGFDRYLDLLLDEGRRGLFDHLMRLNSEFCVKWANAQVRAGATAICYFDPLASTDMLPLELYRSTGFEVAKNTISRINAPTATHLASARTGTVLPLLAETGTGAVGFSSRDDLDEVKKLSMGRISLIGNLNGIDMRNWSADEAQAEVTRVLDRCAPGGGFILSDNHGEIPWFVPENVLEAISDAMLNWRYPTPGEAE